MKKSLICLRAKYADNIDKGIYMMDADEFLKDCGIMYGAVIEQVTCLPYGGNNGDTIGIYVEGSYYDDDSEMYDTTCIYIYKFEPEELAFLGLS